MRLTLLRSILAITSTLPLAACGVSSSEDGGAAHIGVVVEVEGMPSVSIDDEIGTEVRVFMNLDHMGGPDAETLEVVAASLKLDLEHYADIELAIPAEHAQFAGLADGESFDFELRGNLVDTHVEWGLCGDPQAEDADEQRVTLDLELRITPGANDDADEHLFESLAVELHCTHTN